MMVSGCAGSPIKTWSQTTRYTKLMLKLKPDMTQDEVVKMMGNPDNTEIYRGKNSELILVYLYITKVSRYTSLRLSETNYTPLVFENNKLVGWGWNYFRRTAQKYEFVIKDLY